MFSLILFYSPIIFTNTAEPLETGTSVNRNSLDTEQLARSRISASILIV